MKITFLGTGTSTGTPQLLCQCPVCRSTDPKDTRLRCSVYIETETTSLLVDCGPDFRQQALRERIRRIDGVILTHEHYDHVGGLDDLRPFCLTEKMPLYAFERVINQFKLSMPYSFNPNPYPGVPLFEVHPVTEQAFSVGDIQIEPIIVKHLNLPVLGIRINEVAYLTDFNSISTGMIKKLTGVKTLIVDALRKEPHISHNTLQQALDVIEQVKPDNAWLIHMRHDMGLQQIVNQTLPSFVQLAWDGLRLEV